MARAIPIAIGAQRANQMTMSLLSNSQVENKFQKKLAQPDNCA